MKKIINYQCEYCYECYSHKDDAIKCEKSHDKDYVNLTQQYRELKEEIERLKQDILNLWD